MFKFKLKGLVLALSLTLTLAVSTGCGNEDVPNSESSNSVSDSSSSEKSDVMSDKTLDSDMDATSEESSGSWTSSSTDGELYGDERVGFFKVPDGLYSVSMEGYDEDTSAEDYDELEYCTPNYWFSNVKIDELLNSGEGLDLDSTDVHMLTVQLREYALNGSSADELFKDFVEECEEVSNDEDVTIIAKDGDDNSQYYICTVGDDGESGYNLYYVAKVTINGEEKVVGIMGVSSTSASDGVVLNEEDLDNLKYVLNNYQLPN